MPLEDRLVELHCDALIFDLDGVLVDSIQCIENHWRRWAAAHHLAADEILRHAHGRRSIETIQLMAPHLDAEKEAAQLDTAEAADTDGLAKVKGAAELIASIPAGAWAVATSGSRPLATTRLAFAGLPIPPVLVTAGDVRSGKPHPEAYLRAAERLGMAVSKCVVIEDAPAGIQAARSAGMRVIAVAATHPPAALTGANVVTRRLNDIKVDLIQDANKGRFAVQVKAIHAAGAA